MTFDEFESQDYGSVIIPKNGMADKYNPLIDKMIQGQSFTIKELKDTYGVTAQYLKKSAAYYGYTIVNDKTYTIGANNKRRGYNKYRLHSKHLEA